MKYSLKPSLEQIAMVKIVVILWNQTDVKRLIVGLFHPIRDERWQKIERRVIEKGYRLLLPSRFKEKVIGFIKPIGLQILAWFKFNYTDPERYFHLQLPAEFCWTSQSILDSRKTAEMLLKNETISISKRYKMACIYCIESSVRELWCKMPEDLKESLLSDTFPQGSYQRKMVFSWTNAVNQGEWTTQYFSYKSAFEMSAKVGNKAATEYLLHKLTPNEREECLIGVGEYVEDADVLRFLFSEMTEEQKVKALQKNQFEILCCFLDWPLQQFFMEIVDLAWEFLSYRTFTSVVRHIAKKMDSGYKDWNYEKLFVEFWQKSSDALKIFTIDESESMKLMYFLQDINSKEIFRLILESATYAVKRKIAYSNSAPNFFNTLMIRNKWDFLKIFIQESFPSRDEMLKFKREFENSIKTTFYNKGFARYKHGWDELFHLSDDSICN